MASNIDPQFPVTGNPTTQSVRDNFQAAYAEITALQANDVIQDANIAQNAADIAANLLAIGVNTSDIAALDVRVTANEGDIAQNVIDIAANTAAIGVNTGNIATNAGDIATNAVDIAANTASIVALDGRVTQNEADIAALESQEVLPVGTADGSGLVWDVTGASWIEQTDLTITDAGNVGIGTAAPSSKLEIESRAAAALLLTIDTLDGQQGGVNFRESGANSARMVVQNGNLDVYTGAILTKRMTVVESGFVGIGQSSPLDELHVANAAAICSVGIDSQAGSQAQLNFRQAGVIGARISATGAQALLFQTGGTTSALKINELGIVSGTWNNNGTRNPDTTFRQLTQAQYDALTPDNDTIYFIEA